MNNSARFTLRFYAPLAVAVLLLLLMIFSPKLILNESQVKLEAGFQIGVLGIKVPLATWLEHVWVIRAVLMSVIAANLVFALTIDFSLYFPSKLRMDVYFDVRGLERTLSLFTNESGGEAFLADDWHTLVSEYDRDVSASLDGLWKKRGFQGTPTQDEYVRDLLHARGETTFKVNKIGWLVYKIVESQGLLEYELDVPKKPRRRFRGEFYLRDSVANHIRPSLRDLLRSPSVILRPEFKQVFAIEEGGADAPFDHILVGMTRVLLLPVPSFSNTLYLWKAKNGRAVPVAYCVYY